MIFDKSISIPNKLKYIKEIYETDITKFNEYIFILTKNITDKNSYEILLNIINDITIDDKYRLDIIIDIYKQNKYNKYDLFEYMVQTSKNILVIIECCIYLIYSNEDKYIDLGIRTIYDTCLNKELYTDSERFKIITMFYNYKNVDGIYIIRSSRIPHKIYFIMNVQLLKLLYKSFFVDEYISVHIRIQSGNFLYENYIEDHDDISIILMTYYKKKCLYLSDGESGDILDCIYRHTTSFYYKKNVELLLRKLGGNTNNIYEDSQNVHHVTDSVNKIINTIHKFNPSIFSNIRLKILNKMEKICTESDYVKIVHSIDRIYTDPSIMGINNVYLKDILVFVLKKIKRSINNKNILYYIL